MFAGCQHLDIPFILTEDVGNQFIFLHVFDAVSAPAVGKITNGFIIFLFRNGREGQGADDGIGYVVGPVADAINEIAEAPAFDNQFPAGRLTIITALDVDGNSISQKFLAQFLESRVDGLFEELPIPAENSMHSQEKKENSGFSSSFPKRMSPSFPRHKMTRKRKKRRHKECIPSSKIKMKDMNKLIVLYKLYHIEKYVTNGRNH